MTPSAMTLRNDAVPNGWSIDEPPAGSALRVEIASVSLSDVAVHEGIRDDHLREVRAWLSEQGWDGPLIAVIRLQELAAMCATTYPDLPTYGVADGHHRIEVLRQLHRAGQIASPVIPVQVISLQDGSTRYLPTPDDVEKITPCELLDAFATGNLLSPKGTRFECRVDDAWLPVREAQPAARAPYEVLFGSE